MWFSFIEGDGLATFLSPEYRASFGHDPNYHIMTNRITTVPPKGGDFWEQFAHIIEPFGASVFCENYRHVGYAEAYRMTNEYCMQSVNVTIHFLDFSTYSDALKKYTHHLAILMDKGFSPTDARKEVFVANYKQYEAGLVAKKKASAAQEKAAAAAAAAAFIQEMSKHHDFGFDTNQPMEIGKGELLSKKIYDVDELKEEEERMAQTKKRFWKQFWKHVLCMWAVLFLLHLPAFAILYMCPNDLSFDCAASTIHDKAHGAATKITTGLGNLGQEARSMAHEAVASFRDVAQPAAIPLERVAVPDSVSSLHDNLDLLTAAAKGAASLVMDFWVRGIEQSTRVMPPTSTLDHIWLNATAAFATKPETVPAPSLPTVKVSPFETMALVENWMTPSYFDEFQGLAFFGLQEIWFPTIIIPEEENDLDADIFAVDCCQQDDLACRVKAITSDYYVSKLAPGLLNLRMMAVDYIPALAPYLLDETADHAQEEEDHEIVYDDATLDVVGFFLRHEHTLFRAVGIPEPIMPKQPVLLKRASFSGLTPATVGSARCDRLIVSQPPVVIALEDGLSPHYHQCMQWSFINMSPSPVRPVSTVDTGRFTADGIEEESNAPSNPSPAHASPALPVPTERFTADASGLTLGQKTTDLAPMLSPALFVPTNGQTPVDGVGQSPSNNSNKNDAAHAAITLVCSSDDSLLGIASQAMQLVQTYLHEKNVQLRMELQTTLDANPTLKTILEKLGCSEHPNANA